MACWRAVPPARHCIRVLAPDSEGHSVAFGMREIGYVQ